MNEKWSVVSTYNYNITRGVDFKSTYEYAGYTGQHLPSYQNQSHSVDLSINRKISIKKSRLYFGVRLGIGVTASKTKMDLLNADGITYSKEANGMPYRLANCPQAICRVGADNYQYLTYDNTFETIAEQQPGGTSLGNHQIFLSIPIQMSMMIKMTDNLDLGLAWNMRITTNDYIDGFGEFISYHGDARQTVSPDLFQSYRILAYYRLENNKDNLSY